MKLVCAALLLSSGSAAAADALTPPLPTETYNWSGFYAGVSAGYVHGNAEVRDFAAGVAPGPFSYDFDGGIGSGQIGYNYQIDNLVLGLEGDLGYMGSNGHGIIGSANAGSHQDLTLDGGLFGDLTGRLGYAFGPAMVYAKGGFAFFNGEAKQQTTNPGYSSTGTDIFTGWTLGGGLAYRLSRHVSMDLGYQHFDFGHANGHQTALVADPPTPAGQKFPNRTSLTADMVKIGLSYHF
jgi:outer membrane immunogenic protein